MPIFARGALRRRLSIHAFYQDEAARAALEAAMSDVRLATSHAVIDTGGAHAAVACLDDPAAKPPDILLVELSAPLNAALSQLDRLLNATPQQTKVIVLGQDNTAELFRELLRRQVSDYLPLPATPAQIVESILAVSSHLMDAPARRVIAFLGAKGGVGSSAICHNVAWAIANTTPSEVIVADLDVPLGGLDLSFGQCPASGTSDALQNANRLDANMLNRLLVTQENGLRLLFASATLNENFAPSPDAVGELIGKLAAAAPVVALDLPNRWNAWVKHCLSLADDIVLTAEPDLINLRNVNSLVLFLQNTNSTKAPPRLVLNRIDMPARPELSVSEFCRAVSLPASARFSFDARLFGIAARDGLPIGELSPRSHATETFRRLGRLLMGTDKKPAARPRPVVETLLTRLRLTSRQAR